MLLTSKLQFRTAVNPHFSITCYYEREKRSSSTKKSSNIFIHGFYPSPLPVLRCAGFRDGILLLCFRLVGYASLINGLTRHIDRASNCFHPLTVVSQPIQSSTRHIRPRNQENLFHIPSPYSLTLSLFLALILPALIIHHYQPTYLLKNHPQSEQAKLPSYSPSRS